MGRHWANKAAFKSKASASNRLHYRSYHRSEPRSLNRNCKVMRRGYGPGLTEVEELALQVRPRGSSHRIELQHSDGVDKASRRSNEDCQLLLELDFADNDNQASRRSYASEGCETVTSQPSASTEGKPLKQVAVAIHLVGKKSRASVHGQTETRILQDTDYDHVARRHRHVKLHTCTISDGGVARMTQNPPYGNFILDAGGVEEVDVPKEEHAALAQGHDGSADTLIDATHVKPPTNLMQERLPIMVSAASTRPSSDYSYPLLFSARPTYKISVVTDSVKVIQDSVGRDLSIYGPDSRAVAYKPQRKSRWDSQQHTVYVLMNLSNDDDNSESDDEIESDRG
ncbi:hypothetical protein LTR37_008958 [Vermiconidia calcicola]|uniref:Uncharacterized protein n=1 Tax=Vermiconidia calcicola TaxID=1690605 RepID=A0ACC3N9L5_9PEZI|nr:hypothetical protein LTR37_008958 [Vermiconidia calcicola]